jgi:serine/threonine-protein kinase
VAARSGDAWYRSRKFLRRHWVPAAAAVLVVASLSTGLYVANRARLLAERRFGELRRLSTKVFDLDQAIKGLPGATEARERLVSTSLQYLEGLGASARGDLDLAQEVADGYLRVARIQGVPTGQDLGHFERAGESLKKAEALTEAVLAARPGDPAALYRSARIAHDRMVLAASERRSEDSLAFADRASRRLEAFLRSRAPTPDERDDIAMIYSNISIAYRSAHRYADSARYARQGADVARALPAANRRFGPALGMLANALRDEGDLEGALQAITEARKLAEDAPTRDATSKMIRLQGVLLRQGLLLDDDDGVSLGRPDDAVEPLQKALDIAEEAARQSPHDFASRGRVGATAGALGTVLCHRDPRRALEVFDLGTRRLAEVPDNLTARRDRAQLLAASAEALLALQRLPEAGRRIDESLAIFRATHDYPAERIGTDSGVVTALRALADYDAARGDTGSAIAIAEGLLERVMASRPDPLNDLPDATRLSTLYRSLLALYRRRGDREKAEATAGRLLELWRHWESRLPGNAFVRRQLDALAAPARGPARRT